MKKSILLISILSIIGIAGYYNSNKDIEINTETSNTKNNSKEKTVIASKQAHLNDNPNFDYRLNMEKTYENGYVDGKCTEFGFPCMMEERRLGEEALNRHKAAIQKANEERDKKRLIARKEIEKIQEEARLKKEYEANRDFVAEVSEYTPIIDSVIDFEYAKEIDIDDTDWEDFFDDYDFKTPVVRDGGIKNYKTFKTATSEQYYKLFKKNGNFFTKIPLLTSYNNYEYIDLSTKDCKKRNFNSQDSDFTIFCENYSISVFAKMDLIKIEVEKKGYGRTYQFIEINNKGEMLVYNEHNEDGSIRKIRDRDFSNFEGQKDKTFNFKTKGVEGEI